MDVITELIKRAQLHRQRIVLPEGNEPRTVQAANRAIGDSVAEIYLLGDREEILDLAQKYHLKNIEHAHIINPATSEFHEEYAEKLVELRKSKGLTIEEARKLISDPLYYGCMMIKTGMADGQLAGACNATANVLRPALQIIKTEPGITCVSGAMILLTHAAEYGANG